MQIDKIYELGSIITDRATGLSGMLTHLHIEPNGMHYHMQPRGLNPETGGPSKKIWMTPDRVMGGVEVAPPAPIPMDILGTFAEDKGSGFCGTVIALVLHNSGCYHATIQPHGKVTKTGGAHDAHDFDLRFLKGPKIPDLTKAQVQESQAERPSPSETEKYPFS